MDNENSIMGSPVINVLYIKGYPLDHDSGKLKVLPQTYAMEWAMRVTGINRLFTRDDMYEFLVRLVIILDSRGIVEDWFTNDRLFGFTVNDEMYVLTIEDVIFHYGIENFDTAENKISREHFFTIIDKGFSFESFLVNNGHPFRIAGAAYGSDINQELISELSNGVSVDIINRAELFASHLMKKYVPDDIFINISEKIKIKNKQLAERRKAIENLPVFDVLKIPVDIRKKCYEIMFAEPPVDNELIRKEEDRTNPDIKENKVMSFLHLAWLFANDLMVDEGHEAWPVEGVKDFDVDLFGNGLVNLKITFEEYYMDECVEILKGVGV